MPPIINQFAIFKKLTLVFGDLPSAKSLKTRSFATSESQIKKTDAKVCVRNSYLKSRCPFFSIHPIRHNDKRSLSDRKIILSCGVYEEPETH